MTGDPAPRPVTDDQSSADASQGTGRAAESGAAEAGTAGDVTRKFQEALERKHGPRGAHQEAGADQEKSRVHGGAHGPARTQRSFRRKAGG